MDGRLFEQLVERLLNLHFGGTWSLTKVSWDGGKDVVSEVVRHDPEGQARTERAWAECKMHRAPVPLKLVSNTLVMAVIDGAKRLMLFSYSPLIDNARIHLARYSHTTGISVEIIDDEALEALVLDHFEALGGAFFPGMPAPLAEASPTAAEIKVITRLTRDFDIDPMRLGTDDDGEAISPSFRPTLSLGAILRLQMALHNRSIDDERTLRLLVRDAEPMASGFELLNGKAGEPLDTPVAPRSLSLVEFYFRAAKPGQHSLPTIEVCEGERPLPTVEFGRMEIRAVLRPPLIGGAVNEARAKFKELVSLRATSVFAVVSGQSGTGKSRLASEFVMVMLESGRELYRFDGAAKDGGTFDHFARKLLAQIYRLPDLPPPNSRATDVAKNDNEVGLYNLLYDPDTRPQYHFDEVLALVKTGIRANRVGMVIDNVQYLPPTTVNFLAQVVDTFRGAASRLACVFVFNTDDLPLASAAKELLQSLKALKGATPDEVLFCELKDLTEGQVNEFLDHLFADEQGRDARPFTEAHEDLAALLRSRTVARPLHLLQVLYALIDQHALTRRGDSVYVADIDRLHAAIYSTPKDLKEVLKLRWDRIVKMRPDIETPLHHLTALRFVPAADWDALGLSREHWDELVGLGIAEETESDALCFFHEQIERAFWECYGKLTRTQARGLLESLHRAGLADDYLPSLVIVSAQTEDLDAALLRKACQHAAQELPSNHLNVCFGNALRGLIRRHSKLIAPREELVAIRQLVLLVSAPETMDARCKIFDAEVASRKRRLPRFAPCGPEFSSLLRDHASWRFATGQDARALTLLQEAQALVQDGLGFPNQDERDRARANILNRICVALKSLGDAPGAEVAGRQSLEIASRLGAHALVFLNHVDLGYIHYGSSPLTDALHSQWSAATATFHANEAAISAEGFSYTACARMIEAHCELLAGNLAQAAETIELWGPRCLRSKEFFYGVAFQLLHILCLLKDADPKRHLPLLRDLCERVIDTCTTFQVTRSYWCALHARAKVALLAGETEEALRDYGSAAEQLLKVTSTASEPLKRYFFEDAAIQARRFGLELPASVAPRHPQVRAAIAGILAMDRAEAEHFKVKMTYTDRNGGALICP
ncbi:MAG: restriction endonuclease [Actinomycetota bacterium]